MKTGLTLSQMAAELTRQAAAKRDFVADSPKLSIAPDGNLLGIGASAMPLTELARKQVHSTFRVPAEFAERLHKNHPAIYAPMLTGLFAEDPQQRLVRTMDGKVRAFLSGRYRPLDNHDLAEAILPTLMEMPELRIESTQITETRFYLKAVFPRIEREVVKGDVVQLGLAISNSEVGAGALSVHPLVFRLVCLNGMICPDHGQRRFHIGRKAEERDEAYEVYTDRTRNLDNAAFFSKLRDTVRASLNDLTLESIVAKMREAKDQPLLAAKAPEIVELVGERFGHSEGTRAGILGHLIGGGDLTRYGLMNAITRQSQDEEDYDTATRLETDGSRIIELGQGEWQKLAA